MLVFSASLLQPLVVFAVSLSYLFIDATFASEGQFNIKYERKGGTSTQNLQVTALMTKPDERGKYSVSFSFGAEVGGSEISTTSFPEQTFNINDNVGSILDLHQQFSGGDYNTWPPIQYAIPVVPLEWLRFGEEEDVFFLSVLSAGQEQNGPYSPSDAEAPSPFMTGLLSTTVGFMGGVQWHVEFLSAQQQNSIQLTQHDSSSAVTIFITWSPSSNNSQGLESDHFGAAIVENDYSDILSSGDSSNILSAHPRLESMEASCGSVSEQAAVASPFSSQDSGGRSDAGHVTRKRPRDEYSGYAGDVSSQSTSEEEDDDEQHGAKKPRMEITKFDSEPADKSETDSESGSEAGDGSHGEASAACESEEDTFGIEDPEKHEDEIGSAPNASRNLSNAGSEEKEGFFLYLDSSEQF